MTSRRSLSKKKGSGYSFATGLGTAAVPAVLAFVVQFVAMAAIPLFNFIEADRTAKNDLAGNEKFAKDIWEFYVFGEQSMGKMFAYPVLIVLGVLGIMTAVFLFRFICDKRTVNVYYSLGIKRQNLFLTKYAAGAIELLCSTALAVIFSYAVNLIYLGASWQLSVVLLHFFLGLSLFLLLCFTAASVVFSSVGTVSEGIVYSLALIFAPTVFFFGLQQICTAFLRSSVFSQSIMEFEQTFDWGGGQDTENMIMRFAEFNPLLYFSGDLTKYSVGKIAADGKISLPLAKTTWDFPSLFMHIPSIILIAALLVLAVFLFRRIKAENCGFLNTNKVFSNLLIFEACLLSSTLWLPRARYNESIINLVLPGIGAALAVYIVIEVFLKRNIKNILKTSYKFAAHMAVIGIICTIAMTGAFGYESRIPDISKIEYASAAMPLYMNTASLAEVPASGYSSNGVVNIDFLWSMREMPQLKSPEDIKLLTDIHKAAVSEKQKFDENGVDVYVRYHLKNGKDFRRKLHITDKNIASSLFSLYDSSAYKQAVYNLFYQERNEELLKKITSDFRERSKLSGFCFEYDYADVETRSSDLIEGKVLNLTREQFYALKDAVYKDVSALSGKEYFNSSYEQIGVLTFKVKEELISMTEGVMTESDMHREESPEEELPQTDNGLYKEEISGYNHSIAGDGGMYRSYNVIIDGNMKNTIAALNSFGMGNCFASENKIEAVSFIKCDYEELHAYDYYNSNLVQDFYACSVGHMTEERYESKESFIKNFQNDYSENIITDRDKTDKLKPLLSLHRYTGGEGYFAIVKYENSDDFILYFIPENWAPDFVRNFTYTDKETPV